jgi:uncharacterized protein YndB with AHSA1/START domain
VTGPIVHVLSLRCSAEHAFAVYTERFGEWWDARYTANPDTLETVTIEPGIGGQVYAVHSDIGMHSWGEVTEWDPPRRLVHTFALAQSSPSEVAVEFEHVDDGCRVHFEHRGWTEENAADRAKFGDWPVLLERFAAVATS